MTIMKKILNSFAFISLLAIVFSCVDESLDPLQFEKVAKGTIIALRGDALNQVYVKGKPIAELFPKIANGTEKFTFEAEILASDPSTIASVDVYAVKKVGTAFSRVLLKNVPASAFATDKYPNPSTTITITITEMLTALGLPTTFPMSAGTISTLLTDYKFGIGVESDLNLVDGTKVLAADIVAAGLFQSNQFYPAMILNWAVTDYCAYAAGAWAGVYDANENSEINGGYGPYDAALVQDGANPNKFTTDNFYDSGWPLSITLNPSTDVATQTLTASGTVTTGTGNVYVYSGTGTYNQCLNTMSINMEISRNGVPKYDVLIWSLAKQ
jgi:hypothetical protein